MTRSTGEVQMMQSVVTIPGVESVGSKVKNTAPFAFPTPGIPKIGAVGADREPFLYSFSMYFPYEEFTESSVPSAPICTKAISSSLGRRIFTSHRGLP